jgi:hypothetical protein
MFQQLIIGHLTMIPDTATPHAALGRTGHSSDDPVEPLAAERGLIAEMEAGVALERAFGVERDPATTTHVVALVEPRIP